MADFSQMKIVGVPSERAVLISGPGIGNITMTPEYAISMANDLLDAAMIAKKGDQDV
jgi:hypothetical protein